MEASPNQANQARKLPEGNQSCPVASSPEPAMLHGSSLSPELAPFHLALRWPPTKAAMYESFPRDSVGRMTLPLSRAMPNGGY